MQLRQVPEGGSLVEVTCRTIQGRLLMRYFQGNAAREIARLTGCKDRIWADRYHAIQVTDEEEAQVKRLSYVLSNCVKENLVARVADWPGVHCGLPLLAGERVVEGTWFNRRMEYNAAAWEEGARAVEFTRAEQAVLG